MTARMRLRIIAGSFSVAAVFALGACADRESGNSTAESPEPHAESLGSQAESSGSDAVAASPSSQESILSSGTEDDWGLVRQKARWAYEQGLDSLPMGLLVARIGETFLGTPYAARTLEVPGEERLIVELNELDCVTFVESALAIARLVKSVPVEMLDDEMGRYRFMYAGILERIRYRGGKLSGYPSRLHYFSEWISDNDRMGIVQDVTARMDGSIQDAEPIDFMTTHVDAYRQLEESPVFVDALRAIESELNRVSRVFLPQDRIAESADRIRTGDIIGVTSTVQGLDVAHTGIAVWRAGELYLLHAPLSDGFVEVSERPLALRVQEIAGQDGIMIARPSEIREY